MHHTTRPICPRYMALAFSVIGTLVDLVPEALLLTEIVRNLRVFETPGDAWRVFKLLFSDGKPVIRFAAEEDENISEPHHEMRNAVRWRLGSIAASLYMRDGLLEEPKWTYAGLIAFIVGGELLTATGAAIFLYIEFSIPALVSLMASIYALLASTRENMRRVGEKPVHVLQTPHSNIPRSERFFKFAIPGPLVFVRVLLMIPVWPLIIIYLQAAFVSFVKIVTLTGNNSDMTLAWSDDAIWVSPVDWFRINAPVFDHDREENPAVVSFLSLLIIPHLLTTGVVAAWAILSLMRRTVLWFFGYRDFIFFGSIVNRNNDNDDTQWAAELIKPESEFHRMSSLLQGAFGLAFTSAVSKNVIVLSIFLFISIALIWCGFKYHETLCTQQEWVFVFSVTSWWLLMLIVHVGRRINAFKPIVTRRVVAIEQPLHRTRNWGIAPSHGDFLTPTAPPPPI